MDFVSHVDHQSHTDTFTVIKAIFYYIIINMWIPNDMMTHSLFYEKLS